VNLENRLSRIYQLRIFVQSKDDHKKEGLEYQDLLENAVKTSSVIIKRIDLAGRFFKRLILLQTTCILLNPIYLVCKWVLFWPQL